jgi:hypothetical protein
MKERIPKGGKKRGHLYFSIIYDKPGAEWIPILDFQFVESGLVPDRATIILREREK